MKSAYKEYAEKEGWEPSKMDEHPGIQAEFAEAHRDYVNLELEDDHDLAQSSSGLPQMRNSEQIEQHAEEQDNEQSEQDQTAIGDEEPPAPHYRLKGEIGQAVDAEIYQQKQMAKIEEAQSSLSYDSLVDSYEEQQENEADSADRSIDDDYQNSF